MGRRSKMRGAAGARRVPGRTWWLAALAAAHAGAAAPTRVQTLDQDLSGARVEWSGEIVRQVKDGDDTCFVLRRFSLGSYYLRGPKEELFLACNPGPFADEKFAPGRELQVTGNLGAPIARSIGGQVFSDPLVAGAILSPLPPRPYWQGYPYEPYPIYDPFWRPWPYSPFWPYR